MAKPSSPSSRSPKLQRGKLRIGEMRQLKAVCGHSVMKEIAAGELDEDTLGALALVLLRRTQPSATEADADLVELDEVLDAIEGIGGPETPQTAASSNGT